MAHSVAKSKLGYLYTWGDNCYNQVSSKVNACYEQPQQLESEEGIKIKVL